MLWNGHRNLQTLVKYITLRRTKNSEVNGQRLVRLPEKKVYVEQVELSQQEREEYELACNEGRSTIGRWRRRVTSESNKWKKFLFWSENVNVCAHSYRYVSEGTVLRNYADVLVILMRLRQHCCHPDLLAKAANSGLGKIFTPVSYEWREQTKHEESKPVSNSLGQLLKGKCKNKLFSSIS